MKKLYILSFLFCLTSVMSQTKLKKADQLFKTFYFVDAAKVYEEYLETAVNPDIQTLKNVADSYYKIDDNRNALRWYQKLYDIQGQDMSDDYFLKYIQSMKGVMDYEKANTLTKEHLIKKGDQKQIDHFLSQKRNNDSIAAAKNLYTVSNLAINSSKSDFGAAFYGEKIIFTSARDTISLNKLYSWNKEPFLDLYVADRNTSDGSLFGEKLFLPNVMTKYHEATATVTPDLKTIYYTTNIVLKKKLIIDDSKTNNFQIIKGEIEDGRLVKIENVFFNSKDYSVGHPALSEDGKWLFFASDMPGGYGETDLYVVQIATDGTMSSPANLGPTINTIGNELFPFFRNGKLYFSSDGHYGWGDLDIYESKFYGNLNFSEPRNLGAPMNSNKDDFSFIIDSTESYGYISSNRAMGKGNDDLYYFTKDKPDCNQLVSGKVINSKTKMAIADASIKVYDVLGDLIIATTTDAAGDYKFKVPCGKKLKVKASKLNYSTEEREVETKNKDAEEIKDINFELSKYDDLIVKDIKGTEKVAINPIFFEFDKSNITPQAAAELDKVVFVMQKFPNVKIKIESHTDSRGKDEYNRKLSDDRAKSTQAYIIAKGIDTSRIESAIGYGESRLTNKCSNGIKCTEEEHFKNRRSDFIIIQK
jgi:outer membrane protein OmpA-like peptidoglycan-associated protein/tetratricopeptide (TPR) repeat protein